MRTAIIGFKTTPQIKNEALKLTNELGLTLSSALNGLLKQFIKTKKLALSADSKPSKYALRMLKASEEDIRKGRMSPLFNNADDAILWLNDKNRKYANQLH